MTLLTSLESRLLQHDPQFNEDDTMLGRAHAKNALINAFVRGGAGGSGVAGRYDPTDVKQTYQLHLNVERVRVPETWFQPAMFGLDSAGLGEIAGWVLNGYEEEQRRRMMQVSGEAVLGCGNAVLGLYARILRAQLSTSRACRCGISSVASVESVVSYALSLTIQVHIRHGRRDAHTQSRTPPTGVAHAVAAVPRAAESGDGAGRRGSGVGGVEGDERVECDRGREGGEGDEGRV